MPPTITLALGIVTLITHLTCKNSVYAFKRGKKKKNPTYWTLPYVFYSCYLVCAQIIYTLHQRLYKEFQNNFTQTRFSSYVVTLEPNTQMKWNSVVVKLYMLVFSLRLWSPLAQGKGLGCWPHLLPLELLWHLTAMKSYLGTLLKNAPFAWLLPVLSFSISFPPFHEIPAVG